MNITSHQFTNKEKEHDAVADDDAEFDMLVGMGYSSVKARQALKENDGDSY